MKTRSKPGPAPRHNWVQVKAEYIVGQESLAQIAARHGVALKTLTKHAFNRPSNGGRTWTDDRNAFRAKQAAKAIAEIGADQSSVIKKLNLLRVQVSTLSLQQILERLQDLVQTPDLVAIAKLGIDPHLRVSGPNGDDAVTVKFEPLDPESARAVDRAIEAALGRKAQPS